LPVPFVTYEGVVSLRRKRTTAGAKLSAPDSHALATTSACLRFHLPLAMIRQPTGGSKTPVEDVEKGRSKRRWTHPE